MRFGMTRLKQFQKFVKQTRGRHVAYQLDVRLHCIDDATVDFETQLSGKAYGAQHAYRVFAQAFVGIANQHQAPAATSLTPPV